MFKKTLYIILTLPVLLLLTGCSTQKNKWINRQYHAFTTRYNVYFNATQAYEKGEKLLAHSHTDNFNQPISMFRISDVPDRGFGGSDFGRAVTKSKTAIKAHSIKAKPKKNRNKLKDPKYVRFLNQEEYNPFLHNAWLMWGKGLYQRGEFLEAISVFSYTMRTYKDNPLIINECYIWQLRCYSDMKWFFDADNVLSKIDVSILNTRLKKEYNIVYTNYLLKQKKYTEAIPYLEQAIKDAPKNEKTRWMFLLAQLYQMEEQKQKSYDLYGKVARRNPPYIMELSARIKQTEVFTDGKTKDILKTLTSMSKSDKNKRYLDKIHYAIGNVHLSVKDTAKAIEQYELASRKSIEKGIDKGIALLKMGDIYYAQRKYVKAQPCYSEALGLFNKESEEYKRLAKISPILDEMSVYARNVYEQDSIQKLALMPETEKMKVIESVIAEVKKRKKEAEDEKVKAEIDQRSQSAAAANPNRRPTTTPTQAITDKSWYFYNPQMINLGKNEFQQTWGTRKLEDNWRRKSKSGSVFSDESVFDENISPDENDIFADSDSISGGDSISRNIAGEDQLANDSLKNDPESPEYYLAQLPVTAEEFAASDALIREGLYNVGVILKNGLSDYDGARISLEELLSRFPDNEYLADTYYNLFQIYYRWEDHQMAEYYRLKLIAEFPEDENAIMLKDPNFEREFFIAKQVQDSVYAETYQAYLDNRTALVRNNYQMIRSKYPKAELMPKYMFVYALALLKDGDKEGFKEILELLLKEYPGSDINELASAIGKGIYEGRDLMDGGFIGTGMWARRLVEQEGEQQIDSSKIVFSSERETSYLLLLAYQKGVIDNNRLLFKIANYNFSNFLIKNFDLSIETYDNIELLIVSGFSNYDDILWYKQMLYERDILDVEENKLIRSIIISTGNFELLKKYYSFEDYFNFFEENYNQPE